MSDKPTAPAGALFTVKDLQSFVVYHKLDGATLDGVRGEPELLGVLNERVAPILAELEEQARPRRAEGREVKLIYINDTQQPQSIFMHSLEGFLKKLGPAESVEVDVYVDSDQKLFVKTWGERVLIGRVD